MASNLSITPHPIPNGDAGVKATAKIMEQLARGSEGAANPYIVRYAQTVTATTAAKDQTAEAYALRDAIASTVRFTNEYGERLQTPIITLGWDGSRFDPYAAAGDCDCQTTLLMACCLALGINSRLMVVSTHQDRQFSHVLLMVNDRRKGTWFPLDCTRKGAMQNVTRAAIYEYGKLNELATSQWAKPQSVTGMIYNRGAILASTYNDGLGAYAPPIAYQGRGGRATFGDMAGTATDITNLLLPITEGTGLKIAGANTQAVLVGGTSIGPLATTGIPNLANVTGQLFNTTSPASTWLLVGGAVLLVVLFASKGKK